jgi:hypothetical protein
LNFEIDFWEPREGHQRVQWQGSYESAKQYAAEQLQLRNAVRVQIFESGQEMLSFSLIAHPKKNSPYR